MYGIIKAATASFLMPLPIMAAVFVMGLVILWRGSKRGGILICSAAVTVLLFLSWAPVADRLIGALESQYQPLSAFARHDDLQAIVVLGGSNPGLDGRAMGSAITIQMVPRFVPVLA